MNETQFRALAERLIREIESPYDAEMGYCLWCDEEPTATDFNPHKPTCPYRLMQIELFGP